VTTVTQTIRRQRGPVTLVAFLVVATAVYWVSAHAFDAGRPDLFYLGDAFLHGRLWLERALGPYDVVIVGDRVYVPFAPFPAIALMPLVAVLGPDVVTAWQPLVNAVLAAAGLGLCWWMLARIGVGSIGDRLWLTVLWGFSTAIWFTTARGGVWHTGHLVASILTFAGLVELFGRRRPLLMGLLAGAAFLTRPPVLAALPLWAWAAFPEGWRERLGLVVRPIAGVALGFAPAALLGLWYNWARFGSPLESGYYLAALPAFLEAQRAIGLFSLAHLPMNLDLFLVRLPRLQPEFPFFRPDGLGMSVLVTSPGLLYALRAPFRDRRAVALGITFVLVLLPNLLYYGGGWLQMGYRYALDAIPFAMALAGMAAARHGLPWWAKGLIAFGVAVGIGSVYWAYNLK
jgi:hypothetical protein